ncbi:hypothetical protein [Halioxenophilus sp. WMMB6]|uniref:hypothetical protein n=1 Tax=Halioxenophilus sp. WMMB6 TaxID=3073815 RepID=UPI00295E9832|nr:hypothetical protein [Halioxenophilus sp. WMMB6]
MTELATPLPSLAEENLRLQPLLAAITLEPPECDCITAVMLKILDGKCKMPPHEKVTMEALYRATKHLPGHHLGDDYHTFITPFLECDRSQIAEEKIMAIYEQRVLAETQISRPVMKKFKGRMRSEGVLPKKDKSTSEDD